MLRDRKNIRWIIFDAMGVIFEVGNDVDELLVPYLKNIDPKISGIRVNSLYDKAVVGKLTNHQFWEELGLLSRYPAIENDYLDTCLTLDPNLMDILPDLKTRFSLAILSNDLRDWSRFLRGKFQLSRFFRTAIISGEVKCRKPDPKIFRLLLDKIKAEAGECVFIDDKAVNLQQAKRLGFKTIQFMRNDPAAGYDAQADFHIKNFKQLGKAIERLIGPRKI